MEIPIVSIKKQSKYSSNLLFAYLSAEALKMIEVKEIVFSPRQLTIKWPTIDDKKTYSISNNRTFGFGAKFSNPDLLIGQYELKRIRDGEFQLSKI